MNPGDSVAWYTSHGWAYGRLESIGTKHAHIRRAGKLVKVPKEKIRPAKTKGKG